ncbi:MAG: hypothetical protein ACYC63_04830 [Armatimonadota bacterium]
MGSDAIKNLKAVVHVELSPESIHNLKILEQGFQTAVGGGRSGGKNKAVQSITAQIADATKVVTRFGGKAQTALDLVEKGAKDTGDALAEMEKRGRRSEKMREYIGALATDMLKAGVAAQTVKRRVMEMNAVGESQLTKKTGNRATGAILEKMSQKTIAMRNEVAAIVATLQSEMRAAGVAQSTIVTRTNRMMGVGMGMRERRVDLGAIEGNLSRISGRTVAAEQAKAAKAAAATAEKIQKEHIAATQKRQYDLYVWENKAQRKHSADMEKLQRDKISRDRRLARSPAGSIAAYAGNTLDSWKMGGAADKVRAVGASMNDLAGGVGKVWQGLGWVRKGFLYFTVASAAISMIIKPLDAVAGRLMNLGLQGVKGLAALGKSAMSSAGEMEYLRFRMEAVFGAKGKENFEWLSNFTIGMPFDIQQLGDAFTQLGVFGVQAFGDIRTSMTAVVDTAAALNRNPIDVAAAIGLGSKGAPGGMRRLRQFGITPDEVYAAGGKPVKQGRMNKYGEMGQASGLDPRHAAENYAAIMKVLETKFGGTGRKMANTWQQIVNDMGDMWKRFTLSLSNTEGFRFIEATVNALRTKFMEMLETGQIDKWANQFSSVFTAVAPVVTYIAERLPSALRLALDYASALAARFTAFLDRKTGGFDGMFTGVLTAVETMIPLFQTLSKFYLDIKATSLELTAFLGQTVAYFNWLSAKISGTPKQKEEAAAYYWAADEVRVKFAASGEGSMRQAGKDFVDAGAADLKALIANMKKLQPDNLKPLVDGFNNSLAHGFDQGADKLSEGIEDGVNNAISNAQSFLQNASSLDVMRMMKYMRDGMTANQASKAVQDDNKQRQAFAKEGMIGGLTFRSSVSQTDRMRPGGIVSYDNDSTGAASYTEAESPYDSAAEGMGEATDAFKGAVDRFADIVNGDGATQGGAGASKTTNDGKWAAATPAQPTPYAAAKAPAAGQNVFPASVPHAPDPNNPYHASSFGATARKVGAWAAGLGAATTKVGRGLVVKGWNRVSGWVGNARPSYAAAHPNAVPGAQSAAAELRAARYGQYARSVEARTGEAAEWAAKSGRTLGRATPWARILGRAAPYVEGASKLAGEYALPIAVAGGAYDMWQQGTRKNAAFTKRTGKPATMRNQWNEGARRASGPSFEGLAASVGINGPVNSPFVPGSPLAVTINFNGNVTHSEQVAKQVEHGVRKAQQGQMKRRTLAPSR